MARSELFLSGKTMTCPKCDKVQPVAEVCTACGIVIAKYEARQAAQFAGAARRRPGARSAPPREPRQSSWLKLTGVVIGGALLLGVAYGLVQRLGSGAVAQAERTLAEFLPAYEQLRTADPALGERVRQALTDARDSGASGAVAVRAAFAVIAPTMREYMLRAPDSDVVRAYREQLAALESVRQTDPGVCGRSLRSGGGAELNASLEDLGRARAKFMSDLVLAGMNGGAPQPLQTLTAERDLESVFRRLGERYGDRLKLLVAAPDALSPDQAARVCDIRIALMRQILDLNTDASANLIRYTVIRDLGSPT